MKTMRVGTARIISVLLATASLESVVACSHLEPPRVSRQVTEPEVAPAPYCAQPAEKTATDVMGLKTRLMVIALTCKAQLKYNSFVTGQRTSLASHETALTGYFRRNYGRQATEEHDGYVTQLANVQAQQSMEQGTTFCAANLGALDDVMSVRGVSALGVYAASHPSAQPMRFAVCN